MIVIKDIQGGNIRISEFLINGQNYTRFESGDSVTWFRSDKKIDNTRYYERMLFEHRVANKLTEKEALV